MFCNVVEKIRWQQFAVCVGVPQGSMPMCQIVQLRLRADSEIIP